MHVENQIQIVGLTPTQHRIYTLIAVLHSRLPHIIFISEEFVVKRQANSVGTLLRNKVNILSRDIVILKLLPELCGKVRSYSLFEKQVNHPGRIGTTKSEHIALWVEPITEVSTLDEEFLAIGLNEVMALDGYKACWLFFNFSASCQQDNGQVYD